MTVAAAGAATAVAEGISPGMADTSAMHAVEAPSPARETETVGEASAERAHAVVAEERIAPIPAEPATPERPAAPRAEPASTPPEAERSAAAYGWPAQPPAAPPAPVPDWRAEALAEAPPVPAPATQPASVVAAPQPDIEESLKASGLVLIETNREKARPVETVAEEAPTSRQRRERRPAPDSLHEPLQQVETRK